MRPLLSVCTASAMLFGVLGPAHPADAGEPPPRCEPGGGPVVVHGSVEPDDAKTYRMLPFEVLAGTTRVEVGYSWTDASPVPPTPLTQTVFDLGLWDQHGYRAAEGFRGWSGSRQGRVADGQDPVFVQADAAERGYRPGPVEPGVWYVELGIAAVGPAGADWTVQVECLDSSVGSAAPARPVDSTHVARDEPGWYHGDFHMHGYHSNPNAPEWPEFVEFARAAGLDFLPVTDYVTTQHHGELGPVQEANPDLVVWPGREIITYFGHANALGETPGVVDYRHGFEDVTLGEIQERTKAAGALFQVNHPTIFPGPAFERFCRGCEFTLGDDIDWGLVDTIEVLTGPILVDDSDAGGPGASPVKIQNPFVATAIDLWHGLLREGHKITAVSGSDDKLGPGLGSSATAVHAEQLSRPALVEAVSAGHAYVRTRGVAGSPELELTGVGIDGQTGMMGDTFTAPTVEVTVRLRGAANQVLTVLRDGRPTEVVPVTRDDFSYTFTATRDDGSGPLGTFWRVDVADVQSLTIISNPIFLAAPAPGVGGDTSTGEQALSAAGDAPGVSRATVTAPAATLPATGERVPAGGVLALAAFVLARVLHLLGRPDRQPEPTA